jgi:hypothetical protein
MKFRDVFDRVAWASMTFVAAFAANEVREMRKSVTTLNVNVALLVERTGTQGKMIDDLEGKASDHNARIWSLERKVYR